MLCRSDPIENGSESVLVSVSLGAGNLSMLFHSKSHSLTHVQAAIGASGTTGRARLCIWQIISICNIFECVCRSVCVCMLDDVRCSTERAVRSGVRIGSSSSAGKKRRRWRWRRRRQKQRRRRLSWLRLRFLLAHLRLRLESVAPAKKFYDPSGWKVHLKKWLHLSLSLPWPSPCFFLLAYPFTVLRPKHNCCNCRRTLHLLHWHSIFWATSAYQLSRFYVYE